MNKLNTLLFSALSSLIISTTITHAEEDTAGSTFLSQFPNNDTHSIIVVGDDFAQDFHGEVLQTFKNDKNIVISLKHFSLFGLLRNGGEEQLNSLDVLIKKDSPHIVFIMVGSSDRISTRDATGRRLYLGSLEWRSEYKKRVDSFLKIFKRNKVAVYMIGIPAYRNSDANEYIRILNDIFREATYINGMKYIDTFAAFLDDSGNYTAWGPDLNGKIIKIRDADGQRFTKAGNQMLAHMIERELRRDIKEAVGVKLEPLAGNETEQINVNPDKPSIRTINKEISQSARFDGLQEIGQTKFVGEDIAADNDKVMIKLMNSLGHEEVVPIDLQRPSLSSSIVALVAQKQEQKKSNKINEKLTIAFNDGLRAFNTITLPSTEQSEDQIKKPSSTQSSFYKLLIKGERLAPKAGRADDLPWPLSD